MSRIRRGYEARFGALLKRFGARRREQGIQWLLAEGARLSSVLPIREDQALARLYESRLAAAGRLRNGRRAEPTGFYCDAGLGGLARWLRAAGHEAFWEAGIDDAELLEKARNSSTAVLTTDSMLMERRLLRDGTIPSFWLPPTLSIAEQLHAVFREFQLTIREPRCMSCGGKLRPEDKEALRERIPPRTYRWLDSFFVCSRCDKLFWHGTHWAKIHRQLQQTLW
jgi:uncharacterized protein